MMYAEILSKSLQDRTLEERFTLLEYDYNKLLDKLHFIQLSLEGCVHQNRIIGDDVEQALTICKILKAKIYENERKQIYKERKDLESKLRK